MARRPAQAANVGATANADSGEAPAPRVCWSDARTKKARRRFTRGCAICASTGSRSATSRSPRFEPTRCPAPRTTRGRGAPPPEISTAGIPSESPLAAQLSNVPDITVETVVGMMPRLPAHRSGRASRRHGRERTLRVIWPSPVDNKPVAQPGSYTVAGRVPGTSFAPKATVIVKVPVGIMTPPGRLVEAFPLSQVHARSATRRDGRRRSSGTATSSSAASPRRTRTTSSTTSGTRSASRSPQARSSSRAGTTRRRGCEDTRAATT